MPKVILSSEDEDDETSWKQRKSDVILYEIIITVANSREDNCYGR